jgi:putative iron-dependent peroxidase
LLEALADRDPQAAAAVVEQPLESTSSAESRHDGSLNIGSLKGISQHE